MFFLSKISSILKKEEIKLKEQVINLFNDVFDIILFKEINEDGKTALGKMKHWHIYNIIAKK